MINEEKEIILQMENGSEGTSDVSKSYVDRGDASTLASSIDYTNEAIKGIVIPTSDVTKAYVDTQDAKTLEQVPPIVSSYVEAHKAELKGDKGNDGESIQGPKGNDGVSPTATVSKTGKVTTLTVTDVNGTTTSEIHDGVDGTSGSGSSYDDTEIRGLISANATAITTKVTKEEGKGLFSGSYEDLTNKPTIPNPNDLATKAELFGKVDKETGKGLFTGSYNDLSDKPTIPSAYDDTEIRGLIQANTKKVDDLKENFAFEIGEVRDNATALTATVGTIQTEVSGKANTADVYNKTEVDSMVGDVESALESIVGA